jgi:hypothetical protein
MEGLHQVVVLFSPQAESAQEHDRDWTNCAAATKQIKAMINHP